MPDLNDLFQVSSHGNRQLAEGQVTRWHKQLLIGAGSVQGKPIRNDTQGAMSSTAKAGTQNGITFKCFLCLIYGQAIPIPIPGGW